MIQEFQQAELYGNTRGVESVSIESSYLFLDVGAFTVLFNIVKFPNDPCNATATEEGICYTHLQCDERGGVQTAPCAAGFGICCVCKLTFIWRCCSFYLFSSIKWRWK